jgi:hypothetical protein
MDPLFWMVILAVSILLLFIVAVTLGKIKRGRSSQEAQAEIPRGRSRVSGEDD